MEINYRMIAILEMLFSAEGHISVKDVMDTAAITRRTLIYNLEKINLFLEEIGKTHIEVCRGHLNWDVSQENEVKRAISGQLDSNYVMSKRERKALTVICTAVLHDPVTLEMLCGIFDVSRNTVITEIGEIKAGLADLGLSLTSSGRGGYRLDGEETTVRYYVMECCYSLSSETAAKTAQDYIRSAAEQMAGMPITEEHYLRLCDIITESERQTSLRLNNNSIREAAIYLLLILVRAGNGHLTSTLEDLHELSEYTAAETIICEMREMGLEIPIREQGYIATVLLASKVFDIDRKPGGGDVNLELFSRDLVDTFSAKACVRFDNVDDLVARLLMHVRPMYYRLKYKIKVRNVLTEEIKGRYRELYNLTDLAVKTIETRYGFSIPDDEIAYLCAYIGGWMKRHLVQDSNLSVPRILIVCGTGVGTSLLLREQISSLLGCGYTYVTKDERETDSSDCLEYKLIITTVNLNYSGENIIKVSPFLTQSQQNKLLVWSTENSGSSETCRVEDILKIVKKHAEIRDEGGLTNSLLNYMTHGKKEILESPLHISDVLSRGHLLFTDCSMSTEDVIRLSCQPLIDEGIVNQDYPLSILEIIDMLGLYAEIADGILLAHGKTGETVHGVGLTVTLMKQPVFFSKWDKHIRAIFTLATPDNEAHLFILRDIMKLLRKQEVCRRLTTCDFATADEALAYIAETLNSK